MEKLWLMCTITIIIFVKLVTNQLMHSNKSAVTDMNWYQLPFACWCENINFASSSLTCSIPIPSLIDAGEAICEHTWSLNFTFIHYQYNYSYLITSFYMLRCRCLLKWPILQWVSLFRFVCDKILLCWTQMVQWHSKQCVIGYHISLQETVFSWLNSSMTSQVLSLQWKLQTKGTWGQLL